MKGLETVQDCADTRNYPTELAPAMLAAGRGTDGQEGSLCTAVLASPTAAATKREPPLVVLAIAGYLLLDMRGTSCLAF